MAIDKKQMRDFTARWAGLGYEKGDTHKFWLELLSAIGYPHTTEVKFEHRLPNGGFIDVWLRDASVLVEQKGMHVDLDKPEQRQGRLKTPLIQALDYVEDLPRLEQPRYVVTCNFDTFRVYDRDKHAKSELEANAFKFKLAELADHPEYLGFILDPANSRLEKEKQVSIQAGNLIGRLYDEMRKGYLDPASPESMHALNVLCVRLVFCLYCEDADLFPKDAFHKYLRDIPAPQVRTQLKRLFTALNTDLVERDHYDTDLKPFPYVNGGLFRDEVEVPNFTEEMKQFLLEEVSAPVDWSQISPTIFGGIFESTLNPETRRSGGMHYTSPENIHKVIDPLFLDDLHAEFNAIRNAEGQPPRATKAAMQRFHKKLCSLTFFDPACGSGNFLTETYLCLRKLEDEVLAELQGGQAGFSFEHEESDGSRVSLSQFYGIEINDFAVTVAETALWISRLKANGESMMIYDVASKDFPLVDRPNILHANALTTDWNEVLPGSKCNFIMGNPPFLGHATRSTEQADELRVVWERNDIGRLDYVTGWFKKAIDYFGNQPGQRFAFVSTNSIAQGEPVPTLFRPIFEAGWRIRFAHQTFAWTSEAVGGAAVHCAITGFDKEPNTPARLFTYETLRGKPEEQAVTNQINAYLADGANVFVEQSRQIIGDRLPAVAFGNMPRDGGNLIVEIEQVSEVKADSVALKYLRRYIGARELLRGGKRWCLWLTELTDEDLENSELIRTRIEAVRKFRAESSAASTREMANTPHLFGQRSHRDVPHVVMPRVVSETREYFTVDFLAPETIVSDAAFAGEDPDGFAFAVASSSMFITWQKTVGGRLKSDIRFSNTLVWNTFPLPKIPAELREAIIEAGKKVLAARELHPERSLAEHYKPGVMSAELLTAHAELDAVVDKAFGTDRPLDNNQERLQLLFERYEELISA